MAARNRLHTDRRRAFTLLELLIVLMLIGISVATIVPRLNGTLAWWQLRETALNLQTTMQLASQWARVKQEAVVLVLDLQKGAFSLCPVEEGRPADRTLPGVASQSFGRNIRILRMEGVRDIGQNKVLAFWPDGTSDAATIVLAEDRADSSAGTLWEIALDNRGDVQCQERAEDETGE